MLWKDAFDQSHRPTILDIRAYLSPQAAALFMDLNNRLHRAYGIKATPAYHTKRNGWVIPYRKQGVTFFSVNIQDQERFLVGEVIVQDQYGLERALADINQNYHSGFLQRVEEAVAVRKERAAKRRHEDNGGADARQETPLPGSNPQMLNKYRWVPALPPVKLRELYRSSANGTLDRILLDDVGITLYLRCQQGTQEYALLRSDRLRCHQCGAILPRLDGLMLCACGRQYTFQEYIYSFNGHRMPGGNAQHIFVEFVERWPKARTDAQKMELIDWMIHECHISMSSGLKLRSVLKNLIDATTETAEKLILELAYGDVTKRRMV